MYVLVFLLFARVFLARQATQDGVPSLVGYMRMGAGHRAAPSSPYQHPLPQNRQQREQHHLQPQQLPRHASSSPLNLPESTVRYGGGGDGYAGGQYPVQPSDMYAQAGAYLFRDDTATAAQVANCRIVGVGGHGSGGSSGILFRAGDGNFPPYGSTTTMRMSNIAFASSATATPQAPQLDRGARGRGRGGLRPTGGPAAGGVSSASSSASSSAATATARMPQDGAQQPPRQTNLRKRQRPNDVSARKPTPPPLPFAMSMGPSALRAMGFGYQLGNNTYDTATGRVDGSGGGGGGAIRRDIASGNKKDVKFPRITRRRVESTASLHGPSLGQAAASAAVAPRAAGIGASLGLELGLAGTTETLGRHPAMAGSGDDGFGSESPQFAEAFSHDGSLVNTAAATASPAVPAVSAGPAGPPHVHSGAVGEGGRKGGDMIQQRRAEGCVSSYFPQLLIPPQERPIAHPAAEMSAEAVGVGGVGGIEGQEQAEAEFAGNTDLHNRRANVDVGVGVDVGGDDAQLMCLVVGQQGLAEQGGFGTGGSGVEGGGGGELEPGGGSAWHGRPSTSQAWI